MPDPRLNLIVSTVVTPDAGTGATVVAADDVDYTTIGAACAEATIGATLNIMPGSYAESFTVPTGVNLIGQGTVNITGTVTLAGSAELHNLNITSAAAGICIDADQGGNAATTTVKVLDCDLTTSAAGTGILAAGCALTVEGTTVACGASTGISLVAADTANSATSAFIDNVTISGAAVVFGLLTGDGAGGAASDQVAVDIGHITLELSGASNGIIVSSAGTIAAATPRNGVFADTITCIGAATNWFGASGAGSVSVIGTINGAVTAGVLVNNGQGSTTVEYIAFPEDGLTKDATFRVGVLANDSLFIRGGVVVGGAGELFEFTGDAGLVVTNFTGILPPDGAVVTTPTGPGTLSEDCEAQFTNCEFELEGAAGVVAFQWQGAGGGGATAPLLILSHSEIIGAGTAADAGHVITLEDASLTLIDTVLRQASNAFDCIEVAAPDTVTSVIRWEGSCTLDQETGGAGRAMTLPASALIELQEAGFLTIVTCTDLEQFDLNGGGQTLTPVPVGVHTAQAFIPTAAAPRTILSSIPTSAYVHIAQSMTLQLTGTGVDNALTINVTNNSTTLASSQASGAINPGAATVGAIEALLTSNLLFGSGHRISLDITVAGTAPTNVTVTVA